MSPLNNYLVISRQLHFNSEFWFQKGVQKLQVSQGGTSADFDGGGWSLGTRPRSWSADGHGHGFPKWGRRFFSSGTLQKSRATGSAGPRPSGGPDASSEAFSERRWQRMRPRRVHVGPARSQAGSSKKITYLTRLEYRHIDVPLMQSILSLRF